MKEHTKRLHHWGRPHFWVLVYMSGYIPWLIATRNEEARKRVYQQEKSRLAKFSNLFNLFQVNAPGIVVPFLKQPRLKIPRKISLALGLPILIAGIASRVLGVKDLGKILFGVESPEERRLVTEGIHGLIRHPNYAGAILVPLGLAITRRATYALLLTPLWSLAFITTIPWEEEQLTEEYGEQYIEYQQKVPWKLIPKVF